MKLLSSFSAGLMLSVAAVAVASAPAAQAQKEKKAKKKKAPKLKPSKGFGAFFNAGLDAVNAGDATAAAAAESSMRASAQKADDTHIMASFLVSAGQKFNQPAKTVEGLDLMIASPFTPPDDIKILHYQKGAQAYNNLKNYPLAASSFEKAYELGLRQGGIEANTANAYSLSNDYSNSITWLRLAIDNGRAKGDQIPDVWYRLLAKNANNLENPALLTDTMQYIVERTPTANYWHDSIALLQANYDLSTPDGIDALRLLRKTGQMRHASQYAEYVEKAAARGYSPEIVALLDEGFAAGTIKKSDIAFSEAYGSARSKIAEVKRNWASDESEAAASSKGFLALLTGDSLLSGGEYARAAKMYETALAKGNIVNKRGENFQDRAALRHGIAQVMLGNGDAAKASFAKVTKPGTTKEIAEFWSIFAATGIQTAAPAAAAPAS